MAEFHVSVEVCESTLLLLLLLQRALSQSQTQTAASLICILPKWLILWFLKQGPSALSLFSARCWVSSASVL
ncbi:hypothetical protein F4811DRAFT_544742 [Daldinia bambusicola]|nr:hypothetical protein F4811DRAFT_544742 [Daldinia bambusicola]